MCHLHSCLICSFWIGEVLSISSGSIASGGDDYVLSPRAYRKFSIPTKINESMIEIYRDEDELLCVEVIDSSSRVRNIAMFHCMG